MTTTINIWAWLAWLIIGLIMGLAGGRMLGGKRSVTLDIIVGMIGSCAGGWLSMKAMGDDTPQLFITSLLVAFFVGGAVLWIYDTFMIRYRRRN